MHRRLLSTGSAASKPKENGGIPWFTVIPLSLVAGGIAYFYRQNRNSKLDQQLREDLRSQLVMSPEEMVLVREKNALSPAMFLELGRRAQTHFPPPRQIDLGEFLDRYCMEQLGGEFQSRGGFQARHVLERLEHKLPRQMDLDLALCVLSLVVFSDPLELCKKLFDLLVEEEENGGNEREMSSERFVRVLGLLDDTEQLPVRVLVEERVEYPFNEYHRVRGEDVARRVHPSPAGLTQQAFVDLLMSTDVCVWGACWAHADKNKKR
ncbi:hypothetical protein BASA81_006319 [Batrachochytrium salamandrivorans]|nr:hypothetical protein BASA81_006319 [Batrachochytrium salamandrivorans]